MKRKLFLRTFGWPLLRECGTSGRGNNGFSGVGRWPASILCCLALLCSGGYAEESDIEKQDEDRQIGGVRVSDLNKSGINLDEWSLSVAALEGDLEKVENLVSRGVDTNNVTYGSVTPLHCAAIKGNKEIVNFLLLHGAEVNKKSGKDRTPLWEANFNGQKEAAELLRQHGGKE